MIQSSSDNPSNPLVSRLWVAIELIFAPEAAMSLDGGIAIGEVVGPFPDEKAANKFDEAQAERSFLVVPLSGVGG